MDFNLQYGTSVAFSLVAGLVYGTTLRSASVLTHYLIMYFFFVNAVGIKKAGPKAFRVAGMEKCPVEVSISMLFLLTAIIGPIVVSFAESSDNIYMRSFTAFW
ncbi:hypothetical protein BDB00DRAFT_839052 [Zychaea mexicana]|uniref:uncharacterized protein n=1 Tax=Zychaea mexicana TaxID=64656 RepID=UPI0022FF3702|nr:uncharacterized protein BDB00DRAFT_839052 [Zychaea mexicana]KAI9490127.1 hypothetical protein BDB00DRAFT_839052 [Zychaea mexicana]